MGILSGDPTTTAKAIAKHSLPKPEKSQQTFMSAMRDVLRVIAVSSSLHFMSRHQGTNIYVTGIIIKRDGRKYIIAKGNVNLQKMT